MTQMICFFFQVTRMAGNFTSDTIEDVITAPYKEYFFVLAAVLIGIFADALIIYSILRFKYMQTKTNLFVLNSSFADLLFHLSYPICYVFFVTNLEIYKNVYYVFDQLQLMSELLICAIMFMLEVDFVHNNISRKSAKVSLIVLWIVVTLITIVFLVLYFNDLSGLFSIFFYSFLFLVLICTHFIKYCCFVYRKLLKMDEDNCPITKFRFLTVSLYLVMRFINFVIFCVLIGYEFDISYVLLETIALILCHLNSFANLFLFAYLDKNFKVCFLQTFRCSNNYSNITITYNNSNRR